MRRAFALLCSCLTLGACADDSPLPATSDGSTGGTSTTTSTATTTATTTATATATSTSSTGGDETGFDPPVPECGNGFVEGDEECDDANVEDGDACSSECLVRCGTQWEVVELPPTNDSVLDPEVVLRVGDGTILGASLQENVADQSGNVTLGPFETWLARYDADGLRQWDTREMATVDDLFIAAAAADDQNGLFVVATADVDGTGTDIWIAKLDAADGGVEWGPILHDAPFEDSADVATGVALGPDGNVVVVGRTRAGDGDDDVWVAKLDGTSGSTEWVSTWSGAAAGEFSNDDAGPVAVAPDGSVRVLALEYVDFQTERPTLLRFPADGGPATSAAVPDLPAGQQAYTLFDLVLDSDDNAYLLYTQDASALRTFYLAKVDANGAALWSRTQADFEREGSGWSIWGVAVTDAGEPIVVGELENDYELPQESWFELWVARLDADGQEQCFIQQSSDLEGLSRASLDFPEVATAPDGSAVVTATQTQDGDQTMWLGRFRTP